MLYQLYPPHKDSIGYRNRLADMRESLSEITKVFKNDAIITESEQMQAVKKVMQLSVDCLRFYMYAEGQIEEQRLKEQKEGEKACRMSQA